VSSTPVNLAFGTRFSLLDLLAKVEKLIGHQVMRTHLPSRPGDVRDSQAANDRLQSLFPDVAPIDLDAGLAATLEWMRAWIGQ
jgi:UDP-glucose 4-epimerase